MEDADDTLPRSVISASRAAAAHQKPPVAPALAHQVTEASERISVPTAEPAPYIPLPETDSPSAMEIDQQAATSAETPQSASAAVQSITHSEPVSATSLDVEPPLVSLTPLAFKSRRSPISSINAATSLPQHLESHPPMPTDAPTTQKPVSLAGKKQEKTCDVECTTILASLPSSLICDQCRQEKDQGKFSVNQLRRYREKARCWDCTGTPVADPRFTGQIS
jgi:hypothetical protein